MNESQWLVAGLSALLVASSLAWSVPARADDATGDGADSGSSSSYNYDTNQKPDNRVDQDQPSGDKSGAFTVHHANDPDPFQNEKIQWLTPQAPSTASWNTHGTVLPGTLSPAIGALQGLKTNTNAPAPLLNLPSPRDPLNAAVAVPKSTRQKLEDLAKHARAIAPYRYHYGTVNLRNLADDPYYHYGSYRNDAPRQLSSIGYGTLSNAEQSAPTEGP
ncbi:MAG TPA: hypothetical protein V6D47_11625 [Oscillatoriaceae cyanobacterium]